MFVPDYSYTVAEHDPDQPWIVLGRSHGEVTLADDRTSLTGQRSTGRRRDGAWISIPSNSPRTDEPRRVEILRCVFKDAAIQEDTSGDGGAA
jgi:hypothetical protein